MKEKMIIAGGTGYLGELLTEYFKDSYEIFVLSRSEEVKDNSVNYVTWDGKTLGDWTETLEDAAVLINLAGKNINTSFTEKNKKAILESRIESTEILGKAVENCPNPPGMWLNASAVAVYEESREEVRDEFSPTNGTDFLSRVGQKWEAAFQKYGQPQTLKTVFRISLILGDSEGSAYQTLKNMVKLGLGGKAGSGKQMVSWLGEKDFVRAIDFIIQHKLDGVFNFCNTHPVSNDQLMKTLRKKYGMPLGLPAPEFMINIGAGIIGTAPELVLRTQHVAPKRLIEAGFTFQQEDLMQI